MIDLDQAVDQSYREVSDAEAVARRLEAKIQQIPGAKGLLLRRKYEAPVNFKAIQENLTLTSLITQTDAALPNYCGLDASVKRRMDEEKEAQKLYVEALRMPTERLREANERATKVREQQIISGTQPNDREVFLMLARPHPVLGWLFC